MSRKVLIINLEFPPIGGPGVQRVLKFIRYLPDEEWIPTILCGSRPVWHDWHDPSLMLEVPKETNILRASFHSIADYSKSMGRFCANMLSPLNRLLDKKKLELDLAKIWLNLLCYLHPEPMISWLYCATKTAFRYFKTDRVDAVITSGPPHISHFVGLFLKMRYGTKWVADFRDPWVDRQTHGDRLGVARRLDRIWEKLILDYADRIVVISEGWGELFARKLCGAQRSKICVIHNGYDPEDIPSNLPQKDSCGLPEGSLHIHYNGTIQGATSPFFFFRGLAELVKNRPILLGSIVCTFTGIPKRILRIAEALNLKGIIKDAGMLAHRESLELATKSDVLLLIANNTDKTSAGLMTGKVYEYIATGKPILALVPPHGNLHDFLSDYDQCRVVPWNRPQEIGHMLNQLVLDKAAGRLFASCPPPWIGNYSRQMQTKRLADLLNGLVD